LFLTSFEHLCQVYCIRFVFIDNVPSDLLRLQSCRKVIHNGPEKIVTKYHTSDLYANCVPEGTVADLYNFQDRYTENGIRPGFFFDK
jgi:hypothetical protein